MVVKVFEYFTQHKTEFVTRKNEIPEAIPCGVLSGEIIEVDVDKKGRKFDK